jgi:flagellar biosynthetic protein FliR
MKPGQQSLTGGMTFTSAEIYSFVGSYLWPFFRIAALVGVAPIFGARTVPLRIRLSLALALTVVIAPLLPAAPAIDPLTLEGVLVTVHQVLIGMAMGFALLLVFSAFIIGGQIFAMQMGLGFASLVDPQRGVQVPMVSQFYVLVVTLIFLSVNGHLVVIEVLSDSFKTLPIAPRGLTTTSWWLLAGWGQDMFAGAIRIALPAIVTLMVVNLSFGVMTRAAPQLNIFAVGFPISLTIGFVVIYVMLPTAIPQLHHLVDGIFLLIERMLAGGP